MKSLTLEVEKLIKKIPFVEEALGKGLINTSALARELLINLNEKIEDEEVKVSEGAVVMAIKRMKDTIQVEKDDYLKDVLGLVGNIGIRYHLCSYTFSNDQNITELTKLLENKSKSSADYFYTMSKGINETTMIVNDNFENEMAQFTKNIKIISKLKNLSAVTIKLPEINNQVRGLYYLFFREIAWKGINVLEVLSTTNEFTILVDESDVDGAIGIIKSLR